MSLQKARTELRRLAGLHTMDSRDMVRTVLLAHLLEIDSEMATAVALGEESSARHVERIVQRIANAARGVS